MRLTQGGEPPFAPFQAAAAPAVSGALRGERLSFTRVGLKSQDAPVHVAFEGEDAYYAIFQLSDAQPHAFWEDGRPVPTPGSPKGCLNIVDMRTCPSARLEAPFDSLNIHVPRAFLDALAQDVGAPPIRHLAVPEAWTTPDPVMAGFERLMLTALQSDQPLGPLLQDQIAVATAVHLAETYGGLARPLVTKGALAPWQRRRACEMIAANLSKEVSLGEVAAECRLSLAHFSRAFKVSVGETPHGWLQTARVTRAKTLLAGSLTLAEIAVACGFADQSHFNRVFKRATGVTPGVWRKAL